MPIKYNYVVGFLLNHQYILFTQKTKPVWQFGLLNGIGGKIEPTDESSDMAMIREGEEELANVLQLEDLSTLEWEKFTILTGTDENSDLWRVHFYGCISNLVLNFITTKGKFYVNDSGESLIVCSLSNLPIDNMIPNLNWLISMYMTLPMEGKSGRKPKYFHVEEIYG